MNSEHDRPNCGGRWRPYLINIRLYWRCESCRALASRSWSVDQAVALENCLGTVLRELTAAGQKVLGEERER